ncbi:MAG: XRE family transcriptional regulator [Nitrospirae bacterium]|nr:MAG: XRE family transcriptional regulator [Nitrospirota bacterium]
MSIASNIQAWRLSKGQSVTALAGKAGLAVEALEAIESGELDPAASTLETLAAAIGVPVSWLYGDPENLERLLEADERADSAQAGTVDPVMERVLLGSREEHELYVLLTSILMSGEPKLRLAVEASLRSLAKQAKQPTVPWQSRPPGHFEPPND